MCGAPVQDEAAEEAVGNASVIAGRVVREGSPLPGSYVRLLDGSGEFTAEVVTSATGDFRFYAAPGPWTVRALAPGGTGEAKVHAQAGSVVRVEVLVAG